MSEDREARSQDWKSTSLPGPISSVGHGWFLIISEILQWRHLMDTIELTFGGYNRTDLIFAEMLDGSHHDEQLTWVAQDPALAAQGERLGFVLVRPFVCSDVRGLSIQLGISDYGYRNIASNARFPQATSEWTQTSRRQA